MEESVQIRESAEPESSNLKDKKEIVVKRRKPGIIYLSTLPKYMNVTKIREIFSQFGEIGRVFLQPTNAGKPGGKKSAQLFSEGWVEFKKKKVAKHIATHLNNKQLEVRKKSKFYDFIWNIKYLPRFKWIHLSERLAYEKAAHRQRLRLEISQAKKEANYFARNVDRSEINRKKLKLNASIEKGSEMCKFNVYDQRKTDGEIMTEKQRAVSDFNEDKRTELLKTWFGRS